MSNPQFSVGAFAKECNPEGMPAFEVLDALPCCEFQQVIPYFFMPPTLPIIVPAYEPDCPYPYSYAVGSL